MKTMKAVQPLILIAMCLSMALPALAVPAVQSSTHKPNKAKLNKPNAMAHHHPKHRNGAVHPHK